LNPPLIILAIDPGTAKCGLAVVEKTADEILVRYRAILPPAEVAAKTAELVALHALTLVVVGDATNSKAIVPKIRDALPFGVSVETVSEAYTSQRARERYLRENSPTGWHRFLPLGLRVPDAPYDDYVAVILAEDYLAARSRNL
jgi:RNase H-fold protein (predicted Holliday junction resolvase)